MSTEQNEHPRNWTVAPPLADPHHDPNPWEPLAPGDPLHEGDEVRREWRGVTTSGVVGVQHGEGQVYTRQGGRLGLRGLGTWHVRRASTRPAGAAAQPAEEVELPDNPRLLTDVVLSGGEKITEATWTGAVLLYARHPLDTSLVVVPVDQIEQWTLDGTRARRDGGRPRFVKVVGA